MIIYVFEYGFSLFTQGENCSETANDSSALFPHTDYFSPFTVSNHLVVHHTDFAAEISGVRLPGQSLARTPSYCNSTHFEKAVDIVSENYQAKFVVTTGNTLL